MNLLAQLAADLRTRFDSLFRRRALRTRVDEEVRFHIEMRAARLIESGLSREQAWQRAQIAVGNPTLIRDQTLEVWRYGAMERLIQDTGYAIRGMIRSPGFTVVAVLCLSLGIGANAAIFSLIDRILLRLLPVESPQELVAFSAAHPYPRYEFFRDHGDAAFSGVLGFASLSLVAVDGREDAAGTVDGRLVSGNYFEVLGARPRLGRLITPADDRAPGAHPVVVISHGFWQRFFNEDPRILGRSIRLSPGRLSSGSGTSGFEPESEAAPSVGAFRIIGVAAPGFVGETVGQHPDFWAPMMMQEHFMPGRPWLKRQTANWVRIMARLKPGVSQSQAQAMGTELLRQAMTIERGARPDADDRRAIERASLGLRQGDKGFGQLRIQFEQPLTVLMVMVGVVLLIACANLANLLLARGAVRRREIGIRIAVGAGRGRVIQQLLTESLMLAMVGGAVAVAVAWWGSSMLFNMVAASNPALRLDVTPDLRTFAFTGAVALATALLFGTLPALRATRVDVTTTLKDGAPATPDGGRVGRVLVAAQVTLCVVLLTGAGLFTRTLYNMKAQDLGYLPEDLIVMRVDPISAGYRGDEIGRITVKLLERIRALPGVTAATFSENGLFSGTESGATIRIDGYSPPDEAASSVRFDQVGPGYFTNVGIPLLIGRDLNAGDHEKAPRVAVINENMAKFYFGDRNPLGHLIHCDMTDRVVLTIVGVSANARDHSLREDVHRRMYVSYMQPVDGLTGANFEVRTAVRPSAMATVLRAAVREVAPGMPVVSIKPVTTLIDDSIARERIIARLSAMFGLVAALLASIGLYGVLAYSISRRTNEIGIRMAIGALPQNIVRMVLRETLVLVVIGIVVGLPLALGLSRFVESLLFGLSPNDVATLTFVVGLMLLIALVAAAGPAHRAARIDPLRALRYE
jgi:predicted permease